MTTVTMMVGIEGSGRSKFARQSLVEEKGYVLVSAAEGESQEPGDDLLQLIKDNLQAGKNVVWDDANLIRSDRIENIKLLREWEVQRIICCWMNLPPWRCAANLANKKVSTGKSPSAMGVDLMSLTLQVNQRASVLEPPVPEEGFDEIIEVTEADYGTITE